MRVELRTRLLAAGLTVGDVARAAGTYRCRMSKVLNGKLAPRGREIGALAAAIGLGENDAAALIGRPAGRREEAGRMVTVKAAIERGRAAMKAIGLPWPVDAEVDDVEITPRDLCEMAALRAVLTELLEAAEGR
jgi:transcriptional regulator with XRE-family HTH domain